MRWFAGRFFVEYFSVCFSLINFYGDSSKIKIRVSLVRLSASPFPSPSSPLLLSPSLSLRVLPLSARLSVPFLSSLLLPRLRSSLSLFISLPQIFLSLPHIPLTLSPLKQNSLQPENTRPNVNRVFARRACPRWRTKTQSSSSPTSRSMMVPGTESGLPSSIRVYVCLFVYLLYVTLWDDMASSGFF